MCQYTHLSHIIELIRVILCGYRDKKRISFGSDFVKGMIWITFSVHQLSVNLFIWLEKPFFGIIYIKVKLIEALTFGVKSWFYILFIKNTKSYLVRGARVVLPYRPHFCDLRPKYNSMSNENRVRVAMRDHLKHSLWALFRLGRVLVTM